MKKMIMLVAALTVFASCGNINKISRTASKEFGIQLYSLKRQIGTPELYAQNHKEVFKTCADLGYTFIEAASYKDGKFSGVTPEQFKSNIESAGLKPLTSHIGHQLSAKALETGDFTEALKWWKTCIDAHLAGGFSYIVMPWMKVPDTVKDLQTQCDYLNAVGKLCKENGITFGYHNHSHEFNKVEDKEVMLDYMISHTSPEYVFFQMDVYWTVYGHASPVEYFKKYPGRFKMLHIKDKREIGQSGMVGFDAIFNNADIAGMQNYVIELEGFGVDTWQESLGICARYLNSAPFVKKSYSRP